MMKTQGNFSFYKKEIMERFSYLFNAVKFGETPNFV